MGPREIMLEHIEFWTGKECPPLSQNDMELVKRLADVVGISLDVGKEMECVKVGSVNR